MEITESIFREYDIRGVYPNEINEEIVNKIATAISVKCQEEEVTEIYVGRDGRLSGKDLLDALSKGLSECGINVINIDLVSTPLLYYAAKKSKSKSGVMVTGSHNPKNYNGFKMVINDSPISGLEILDLLSNDPISKTNSGKEIFKRSLIEEYIEDVLSQSTKKLKKLIISN